MGSPNADVSATTCEEGFEFAYLPDAGVERRVGLADAAEVRSRKSGRFVRSPRSRGSGTNPGLWWSATMGRHVVYESWLERDCAIELDFDPTVVAFAPQPFWLFWDQD